MTLSRHNPRAGQRWAVLIGAVVAAMVLLATVVLAVHDVSVFQLDAPSADAQVDVGSTAHHDDWDVICEDNPSTCTIKTGYETGVTTIATASSHENDGALNATIFSGGGSKDIYGISSGAWAWKDEAGGLPDKDNLLHAYAARYSTTPSQTCPVASGVTTCELIYFGSDRYANDGDATQAFWFLQNPVSLGSNKVGGAFGFTGTHRNGDLLIISEFSNGGTKSTITVYKWSCGGTGTGAACDSSGSLVFVAGGENQKCGGSTPDPFCGIVNESETPVDVPWSFTDKAGSTQFRQGELFEAGINLSHPSIQLAGECFSSFVAETRSATSTSAQLKDFVLGQFQPCGATLNTTPSVGAGGEVSPGTSVTDVLTVTGTGIASPPTPSGNATFFMCSFAAGSTDVCDGTTGKVGTQVGSPVALADSSPPAGEAQATSAAVNTSGDPLLPGRYCFRAEWPGDTNYLPPTPPGKFVHFGSGNSECFTVRQIATSTVTTPSDSSGVALTSPVALGTSLYDKAVVTGTAVGGTPTGTVSFWICNPNQVTGSSGSETCASGTGTALSGNPRTLAADSGSSPPSASVLSSPGVTANLAGVWCFRATYTPSGSTYLTSSDNTHGECVTVSPDTTTTVTTPRNGSGTAITTVALNSSVYDYALVTGTAAGGTPTGTVNFFICDPTQISGASGAEVCASGAGTALSGNPRTLAAVSGSSPPAADATSSPAVVVNKIGIWCFRATFAPGGTNAANYTGSSDNSHGECFTVTTTSSATSLQSWLPNDSVTLTTVGSVPLNGTLAITLREGSCTGTVKYTQDGDPVTPGTQSYSLTNTASGTVFTTTNSTFLVSASNLAAGGVYYWRAEFTSSDPYVASFTKCETSTLSINDNP